MQIVQNVRACIPIPHNEIAQLTHNVHCSHVCLSCIYCSQHNTFWQAYQTIPECPLLTLCPDSMNWTQHGQKNTADGVLRDSVVCFENAVWLHSTHINVISLTCKRKGWPCLCCCAWNSKLPNCLTCIIFYPHRTPGVEILEKSF